MSLRRMFLILAAMTILALATLMLTMTSGFGSQSKHLKITEELIGEIANDVLPLMRAIDAVALDVVQVQQWLTDISATRGLNGMDDGFLKAEKYARLFDGHVAAAKGHAQSLGLTPLSVQLDDVKAAFAPYYRVGRSMAQRYVDEGPAGGNVSMSEFDGVAETITKRLESLVSRVEQEVSKRSLAAQAGATGIIHRSNALFTDMLWVVLLVFVIILSSGVIMQVRAFGPLKRTQVAVSKIARGDSGTTVEGTARSDEIGRLARAVEILRVEAHGAFQMKQMFEQLPSAMFVCDRSDLSITYQNPAASHLHSVETEQDQPLGPIAKVSPLIKDKLARSNGQNLAPVCFEKDGMYFEAKMFALTARNGQFKEWLVSVEDISATVAAEEAERNAAQMRIDEEIKQENERKAAMNEMADDFEATVGTMVQELLDSTGKLEATANEMRSASHQISGQVETVSASSANTAGRTEMVAAASEELTASVSEVGRQAANFSTVSDRAVAEASSSKEIVVGLNEAATVIASVLSLINDIADQTNLLALNATIEAARAGEAGRGFAVVASEVKNLANQTAQATDDIASHIDTIQGETDRAMHAIQHIADTVSEMNDGAAVVSEAVSEQMAATQEISKNILEAAAGTREIEGAMSQVSSAADNTENFAQELLTAAERLAKRGAGLEEGLKAFLSRVRT